MNEEILASEFIPIESIPEIVDAAASRKREKRPILFAVLGVLVVLVIFYNYYNA